jgi:hydrogenase maturation factor
VIDTELPAGKLPTDMLARILDELGEQPAEMRLGPAVGEDACAMQVPSGVLAVATDPITLTSADIGRPAVVVKANDVAVMGVRPRRFLACVLGPVVVDGADVEACSSRCGMCWPTSAPRWSVATPRSRRSSTSS